MKHKSMLLTVLLIGICSLLIVGCDTDDSVNISSGQGNSDGRIIGTVHGLITSYPDNVPVLGVTIHYLKGNEILFTTTDSAGYYIINDLTEGIYAVTFTPPTVNYATSQCQVNVTGYLADSLYQYTGQNIHLILNQDIMLYPLNASLTGQVFAQLDAEHSLPANGAQVKLINLTSYGLMNTDYHAFCDSLGNFIMNNLPALPPQVPPQAPPLSQPVGFMVLPWTDGAGHDFATLPNVNLLNGLIPGAEVQAPLTQITLALPTPQVLTNNFSIGDVQVGQDLELTFSKTMDTTSVEVTLKVPPYGPNDQVLFTSSWDANSVTLTIDPILTLVPDSPYQLTITGQAQDYSCLNYPTTTFHTEAGAQIVWTNLWDDDGSQQNQFNPADAIWIQFDKAMDNTNPLNQFNLTRSGTPVLTVVSWSTDNMTVTITPGGALQPNNTSYLLSYEVYSVSPVANLSGNFNFQTKSGAQVVATNLWDDNGFQQLQFDPAVPIWIQFDTAMDITNPLNQFNLTRIGTPPAPDLPVLTAVSWSTDHKKVTITPNGVLQPSDPYVLNYEVYSVLPGDDLPGSFNFQTQSGAQVVGTNLEDDNGNVQYQFNPADPIWIQFDMAMDITNPLNQFNLILSGAPVLTAVSWSEANKKVTITPAEALQPNSTPYQFNYVVYSELATDDLSGGYNFWTKSGTQVLGTNLLLDNGLPQNQFNPTEAIWLQFDNAMDITDPLTQVNLTRGSIPVLTVVSWSEANKKVTITPTDGLQPNGISYVLSFAVYSELPGGDLSHSYPFWTGVGAQIIATNLWKDDGTLQDEFDPADPIWIEYDLAMNTTNPNNQLELTRNGTMIWTTVSWSEANKKVTITPTGGLIPGETYSLNGAVYSTLPNDPVGLVGFNGFRTAITVAPPVPPTGFEYTAGIPIDWNTTGPIRFTWDVAADVSYYIWAQDNFNSPTRIEVAGPFYPTLPWGTMTGNAYLPSEFDWIEEYPFDIQTPFSHDIEVTFYLEARNPAGSAMVEDANAIVLGDSTAPNLLFGSLWPSGSANNTNTVADTITIQMGWQSEYCDPTSTPTGYFLEAGNPGYKLPDNADTWHWNDDYRGGYFTVIIPASSDGSGDYFVMKSLMDNSGNTSAQTDSAYVTLP